KTAVIRLHFGDFRCQDSFDYFLHGLSQIRRITKEVLVIPGSLLCGMFMTRRLVLQTCGVSVAGIVSLMDSHARELVVDLHGISGIDDLEPFSNQGIRHTVMVPVLAQDDMIILRNLALGGIFYFED